MKPCRGPEHENLAPTVGHHGPDRHRVDLLRMCKPHVKQATSGIAATDSKSVASTICSPRQLPSDAWPFGRPSVRAGVESLVHTFLDEESRGHTTNLLVGAWPPRDVQRP